VIIKFTPDDIRIHSDTADVLADAVHDEQINIVKGQSWKPAVCQN
jgi:hypothetical protein